MTIRDIAVAFGFEVDKNSEKQAESSIKSLKSLASKLLGSIAIGFSLTQMNSLAEEFNGINDQIKNATSSLGEQEEIQKKILQAANETKSGYADTAKVVSNLVQENSELFSSVDDAIAFNNATTKLFKTAGKGSDEIASLQEAINKSFAKGIVDTETINQLLERSPEAVKLLNKQLGTTSDQLLQMATNGAISLTDLRDAFVGNADEINKSFDELDYSISDALLNIRNQWGLFCDSLWKGSGITNGVGKMMVRAFTSFMDVLKKLQPLIERVIRFLLSGVQKAFSLISRVGSFLGRLVEKIGGIEQALKLVAIVASAIWLALNGQKILNFIKGLGAALTGINVKILLIVAVIVILALIIEDFINFMQGNDSVIGALFEKAGIDADEARQTIINAWNKIKEFLIGVWEFIKQAVGIYFDAIKNFFSKHGESIRANFERAWGIIKTFLNGVWTFISQLAATLFGSTEDSIDGSTMSTKEKLLTVWQAIVDTLSAIWDALYEVASAIFNAVAAVVETVFGWIQAFWNSWGSQILAWFKVVWDSCGKLIGGFLDVIKGLANFIKSVFTGDWEGAWNAIKEVFVGIWNMIVGFITAIWETIKLLFSMALEAIKAIWEAIWNGIKAFFEMIWNGIVSFFSGIIQGIMNIVSPIAEFFTNIFQSAWDGICNVFSGVTTFFQGVWDKIVSVFGSIGTAISDAISGAVKGAINSVLSVAAGIINGFISAINVAIGVINAIPGVSISKLEKLNVPQLAEGGIATDATKAIVGEGSEPEAIMPLSKLGAMISGYIKEARQNESVQSGIATVKSVAGKFADGLAKLSGATKVSPQTATNSTTSNAVTNVTQNNTFNNTYNGGDSKTQENVSRAMNKSTDDATTQLAKGLAYAR